jgi:hypothetical protein
MYELLCRLHGDIAEHGGHGKTGKAVSEHYYYIPKKLAHMFVDACPCRKRFGKGRKGLQHSQKQSATDRSSTSLDINFTDLGQAGGSQSALVGSISSGDVVERQARYTRSALLSSTFREFQVQTT